MTNEKEFDVVLHALQQHRDRLWKMIQQNMNSEFIGMNIMDDIRLRQIDELDEAIKERTTPPQRTWVGLTDAEVHNMTILMGFDPEWVTEVGMVKSIVRNLESKLKEKNHG